MLLSGFYKACLLKGKLISSGIIIRVARGTTRVAIRASLRVANASSSNHPMQMFDKYIDHSNQNLPKPYNNTIVTPRPGMSPKPLR